ncbi:MAG: hypothetical protein DMG57_31575 [Acidobacteria bacterium]|nr:MAG: hypothetical protein DMG57_31575 [Acidobacteriota bacterium]
MREATVSWTWRARTADRGSAKSRRPLATIHGLLEQTDESVCPTRRRNAIKSVAAAKNGRVFNRALLSCIKATV